MPPVRWKYWLYITSVLIHVSFMVNAQQMQDPISVSSDGWRPIVGSRRQATGAGQVVSQYPAVQSDFVDVVATTYTPAAVRDDTGKNPPYSKDIKTKVVSKSATPYLTGPPHLVASNTKVRKVLKKAGPVKVRKTVRGQAAASSNRNEIFAPPPASNQGFYAFINPNPIPVSNPNTRDGQGIGLINQYNIPQSPQFQFANQLQLASNAVYQRSPFYTKPVQNDEYTRNLVPPPPGRPQPGSKDNSKISLYAFKDGFTDASSNFPQFGVKANNQFQQQVAPIFDYTSQQQPPQQQQQQQFFQPRLPQKIKEQAVDVQVTKENLKQYSQSGPSAFGAIPSRSNYPIEFVDYDFHYVKPKPTNLPNTLTYEVTEGKWLDTSSQQYQFRPLNAYVQGPPKLQQNNARPGLLFQAEAPPTRQPFIQTPIVDLNVPAFLPTPYRPESVVAPTSPTQNEASTVFNRVTEKMNRYRNNAINNNPLVFDIKEVSTHYPVVGNPEIPAEGGTDTPLPMNENGEISNEITTQKEVENIRTRRPLHEPTQPTTVRDPTKTRISNRRRPRPRRPPTTTTEEPIVETYEPIKENFEERPVEVDRPLRRRRPQRPLTKPKPETDDGNVQIAKPEEQSSNKQRGRYRFRSREHPTEPTDPVSPQRKRYRPSFTENIIREQTKTPSEQATEYSAEQPFENYPVQFNKQIQASQETDTPETQSSEQVIENNTPFIEEIHPASQQPEYDQAVETIKNPEHESPENEVDFTTPVSFEQDVIKEDPTTTTTAPEPTTVLTTSPRTHRIRVRPNKYDASNRPRFSVKDYRQRLNQLTSTTPTPATTEHYPRSTSESVRLRYPSRSRTRPSISATTANSRIDEDSTDDALTTTSFRPRFKPNQPRFHTTTESENVITDNVIKAVNTRLRPFGKPKSSIELSSTAAPKISIRPNLFSARRRAGYPSLKNRIEIKHKKDETKDVENDEEAEEETLNKPNKDEDIEIQKVAESGPTEAIFNHEISEPSSTEVIETTTKTDDLMLSQRVSDLTSSYKDYDKPGMFNSVRPTSRSIPNYFTLSTDDPKLPIEAFFPNLKDADKAKER